MWAIVGNGIIVQTDLPIADGPIDPANWSAVHAGTQWVGTTGAQVTSGTITVPMVNTGVPVGGETCCYNASPPDVIGTNGVPVAAFCDFPLT